MVFLEWGGGERVDVCVELKEDLSVSGSLQH